MRRKEHVEPGIRSVWFKYKADFDVVVFVQQILVFQQLFTFDIFQLPQLSKLFKAVRQLSLPALELRPESAIQWGLSDFFFRKQISPPVEICTIRLLLFHHQLLRHHALRLNGFFLLRTLPQDYIFYLQCLCFAQSPRAHFIKCLIEKYLILFAIVVVNQSHVLWLIVQASSFRWGMNSYLRGLATFEDGFVDNARSARLTFRKEMHHRMPLIFRIFLRLSFAHGFAVS